MPTSVITKKQIDLIGGIGSILTGIFCAFIGWEDFVEERAWHIWAVMTLVLLINGLAMFRHAAKSRQECSIHPTEVGEVVKLRS